MLDSDLRTLARRTPVVVALDHEVDAGTRRLLQEFSSLERPPPVKIGWLPILEGGARVIGSVKEIFPGAPIIADIKIADIPYMGGLIARRLVHHGADYVIVHGFAGSDLLREVARTLEEEGAGLIVVAEMSSEGGKECYSICAKRIVLEAARAGAKGIVAPATRPSRILEFRRLTGDLAILAPGVGAQGGNLEDTLTAGADMIIVGRSIWTSKDPISSYRDLMRRALDVIDAPEKYRRTRDR